MGRPALFLQLDYRRPCGDLNCAYAFSVSASIQEVLAELREALENNGFTKAEAERILVPVSQGVIQPPPVYSSLDLRSKKPASLTSRA